jgi:hypothetical protein
MEHVEIHHAFSREVSPSWKQPIRLLWIDGDYTYRGAKEDFDGFAPHVSPGGIIALHDALNSFSGPIRIFVEDDVALESLWAGRFCAFDCVGAIPTRRWAEI